MTEPTSETPGAGEPARDEPKRFLFLRRKPGADDAPAGETGSGTGPTGAVVAEAVGSPAGAPGGTVRPGVIRRRRRQLTDTYQQALFDLGGLAMELHGRGLLVEDVMRRKAAEVADIREQLSDLGARLDEMRQARQERRQAGRGSYVTCPACGARSPGKANFCFSCGAPLAIAQAEAASGDADAEQVTTTIAEEVVVVEDAQPTAAIPAPEQGDA